MIKVLIVDDSLTTRKFLRHIIEADPELQVAGEAKNGEESIKLTESKKPDVIVMDIQMPGMNGYEATRAIMERCPVPIVIHSTLVAPEQTENIFKAMRVGAVAVSQKPPGLGHPDSDHLIKKLLRNIKLMSEVKVVRLLKKTPPQKIRKPIQNKIITKVRPSTDIIVIGASTGGPPLLQGILSGLPKDFSIPIIIVQHIATGFLEGMVDWLSKTTSLSLNVPQTGDPIEDSHVYFAPEDHLVDITGSFKFSIRKIDQNENLKRPITHCFSSVAKIYKKKSLGVLLTGMGNDGAHGLKEMKSQGAVTIAQDKESSIVFGMPGEAIKLNAATYVLSPSDISAFLKRVGRENLS